MAEDEDMTEKILVAIYEATVDELRQTSPGSRENIRATARSVAAWKELKEYLKGKR